MSQDYNEPQRFTIEEEQTRQYGRFNAQGTQLTVRLLPPPEGEDPNPMSHFLDSVTELFELMKLRHMNSSLQASFIWRMVTCTILYGCLGFSSLREVHFMFLEPLEK